MASIAKKSAITIKETVFIKAAIISALLKPTQQILKLAVLK